MKASSATLARPAIMRALRARARGRPSVGFDEFMDVALYDPMEGYYRRPGARIGYGPGTDFLTASASAPLFGRLVVAACARLLGPLSPSDYEFVELGAERGAGIIGDLPHPFRSVRLVGSGDPLEISGPAVVFSNELFDAQPFRRFRFREGAWREIGVSLAGTGLCEVEIEATAPLPEGLPKAADAGYVIDAPLAAARLARTIAGQPWHGLFLAFDYGKPWEELAYATPAGTARGYRSHRQVNDLLAFPGEQDLTCHVCWDWLAGALLGGGFADPCVESQEAFFARHASDFIEAFTAAEAGRISREKLSLLQLLHPAHMGQRFQVLRAMRAPPAPAGR